MRLSRLNLTRYGKFTDFCVDFGAKAPGKPDFHVIFGPNESGKTTTLTAYLDLLFGIEKNSSLILFIVTRLCRLAAYWSLRAVLANSFA